MGALVIILLKKENVTLYLCGFAGCSAALHICDFICGLVKLPAVDTLCPDFTDGNRHNQGRDLLKSALLLGHFLTWQDFHLSTWPLLHIDRYLPGSGGSWTSSPHCKHLMMASNHGSPFLLCSFCWVRGQWGCLCGSVYLGTALPVRGWSETEGAVYTSMESCPPQVHGYPGLIVKSHPLESALISQAALGRWELPFKHNTQTWFVFWHRIIAMSAFVQSFRIAVVLQKRPGSFCKIQIPGLFLWTF